MKYAGFDCGQSRSPLKNLTQEMYDDFVIEVRKLKIDILLSKG